MNFSDRKEFDTDSGANKEYTKEEALKRITALNLDKTHRLSLRRKPSKTKRKLLLII